MLSENQLEKILCYVYIGQHTGEYGLLKEDLQAYEKGLQCSNAYSNLVEMGLIIEDITSGFIFDGYQKPTFFKTTNQGERESRKIMKRVTANVVDLASRLETVPRKTLVFLITHELLKLDGKYPVDLREPPQRYEKDKLDMQRDMYNCILLPMMNPRLNTQLLDAREKLFSTLLSLGLCVTASAYWIYETKRKKDFYVDTYLLRASRNEHKLNYCVPPDVLDFLYNLFKPDIDSFELPKDLQQGHLHYHVLKERLTPWGHIYSDGAGSWLTRDYTGDLTYEIELMHNPKVVDILNDLKTRKLLSLSKEKLEHDGKTWRRINISSEQSEECLRWLEHHFLEPILKFLGKAGKEGSSAEREYESQEERIDIIIDGSNVAYDNVPKGQPPRYRNIFLVVEYYKRKKLKTKIVVDASLRHKIDEKEAFQKALDEKLIVQAPSRIEADDYVLKLALIHQNSKIVSNDDFKDWVLKTSLGADLRIAREVFGRRERFVKFKINGEFIEFES